MSKGFFHPISDDELFYLASLEEQRRAAEAARQAAEAELLRLQTQMQAEEARRTTEQAMQAANMHGPFGII